MFILQRVIRPQKNERPLMHKLQEVVHTCPTTLSFLELETGPISSFSVVCKLRRNAIMEISVIYFRRPRQADLETLVKEKQVCKSECQTFR